MIPIVFANLWRRPGRTLFTALGIAIGVATVVALLSLGDGLKRTAGGLVHLGGADFVVYQHGVSDPTAWIFCWIADGRNEAVGSETPCW